MTQGQRPHLTEEESRECTRMILAGCSSKEISEKFSLSQRNARVRISKALGRPDANKTRYVKPRIDPAKKPSAPAPNVIPGISIERLMGRRA